ncbi:alpha/beta hydrolase [Aliivibrio finisterrensis]|uniref:esterase/lipase family protein n=1 Tax=Aliivibrio finisterrensis TaxID=511998 RepID=UPI0010224BF0|nr:alpha/beta hydrolase [Aliivibrio finisterrensis]RYU70325.1 alpha/beta hydrolase [Aliivibrio finisterrensis]RYU74187.1 alpha/beta hydrolase [Aliivibrio finisterrensis]RYU76792.1 alpha/beta hydrolase [Aliivibrio finisterrensis]
MNQIDFLRCASVGVFFGLVGCSSASVNDIDKVEEPTMLTKQTLQIDGLKHCNNTSDNRIHLNPDEPLTIIAHGCFASAGQFKTLADVYGLYDQQAICFEYDDRKSLEETSGELVSALNKLSNENPNQSLHVIGHSQGGLVARRALTVDREDEKKVATKQLQLTTISSPFNGIEISSHCGITPLRILSLGIVDLICYAVTGEKYQQIPPNADFIEQPGELVASVSQHLVIKTDERNTCRRTNDEGICLEDDYVFSVNEQSNNQVDNSVNTDLVTVQAGHVEIVGNGDSVPIDLISILTDQQLLIDNGTIDQLEQARLIHQLYLD